MANVLNPGLNLASISALALEAIALCDNLGGDPQEWFIASVPEDLPGLITWACAHVGLSCSRSAPVPV